MRKLAAIILVILTQLGLYCGISANTSEEQDLGIPSSESYTIEEAVSRVPWDMIIVNNKLYLGGGDFGDNTGPVDVWCCDLTTKEWYISGTLNDEAIGKFITINDRVYAPGFDAKSYNWSLGNYHWLENDQWYTNNTLPDAVHNFDVTEFDGKLFFALGTGNNTVSPVKYTTDSGQTYIDVPFYKDGNNIITDNCFDYSRVYDFFIIDEQLYCMFLAVHNNSANTYDFYKYKDEAFYYISSHDQVGLKIKQLKQEPIASKITYKGQCYIAAGYLNRTTDFESSEQLLPPQGEFAVDLLVDDDILYLLCFTHNGENYITRIYTYVYNSFFFPIVSFDSANFPTSFAKNGNTFYVGANFQGDDPSFAGSIYEVTIQDLTMQLIKDCLQGE